MKSRHIQQKVYTTLIFAVIAAAILLLGFLEGCGSGLNLPTSNPGTDFEKETPAKERSFYLLESFEDVQEWAVDSAENHADLSPDDVNLTEGSGALKIRYWSKGRGKAQIRKEVDYNFAAITHLMIDIFNPSDDPNVTFGFAFRTQIGDRFFETVPIKLAKGWNQGLVVPLNKKMIKETYGADTYRLWQESKGYVTRIMLQFYEGKQPGNEVIVDNLRSLRNWK
jgi:hypothetical protein